MAFERSAKDCIVRRNSLAAALAGGSLPKPLRASDRMLAGLHEGAAGVILTASSQFLASPLHKRGVRISGWRGRSLRSLHLFANKRRYLIVWNKRDPSLLAPLADADEPPVT